MKKMFSRDLDIYYRVFNRKYFGNRLPKDMAVRFANIKQIGVTHHLYGRPLYILISRKISWHHMLVGMTLLHEMVHVENIKVGHGPWFHKRMLQLAKDGAFRLFW